MARRRGGKKIDFTRWIGSFVDLLLPAGGAPIATFWLSEGVATETLLRIRGNLLAQVEGPLTGGQLTTVAVGICVVPEQPVGNEITWSPIADANAPWLWYESFTLGYEEMVADVVDVPGITSFRSVIDSKSMRILRPDTMIQVVAEGTTVGSSVAVRLSVNGRTLLGA